MSTLTEPAEIDPTPAPAPSAASRAAMGQGAACGTRVPQARCAARSIGLDPQLPRLLRIRVPVIARLAATRMTLADVRRMTCGSIIKLDKSVDADLELLINNHVVGAGVAVKVGDYFGLRIRQIGDQAARIKSLGK